MEVDTFYFGSIIFGTRDVKLYYGVGNKEEKKRLKTYLKSLLLSQDFKSLCDVTNYIQDSFYTLLHCKQQSLKWLE